MSAAARLFTMYLLVLSICVSAPLAGSSNRTNNDAYPVYTALYPYTFLTTNLRNFYRGWEPDYVQERCTFSVSPFRQSAVLGRNTQGCPSQIGDMTGRWNMLALFYPNSSGSNPLEVQNYLLNSLGFTQAQLGTDCNYNGTNPASGTMPSGVILNSLITTPSRRDVQNQFGFFSVPVKYRKWGVRFEAECYLGCNFGIKVETGVCDVIQTNSFVDQTCTALGRTACVTGACTSTCCDVDQFGCYCKTNIMLQIMDQLDLVAEDLGLNIYNYNKRCAEDTRVNLYWRKVYPINQNREGWPYFLMMPYVALESVIPTGNKVNPSCLFAVPGGNDGHGGLGFSAGLNFDFVETIEIGVQASMTEWFKRKYCNYPVPVNDYQQGILPYKANLTLAPAANWTFSALMNAYHFLDRLSVWAQWVATYHGKDCFNNVQVQPFLGGTSTPPNADIDRMACWSRWSSHVINVGLTYDISPNIALGFLWQAPVAQRNSYRATTLMGSLIVTW